MTYLYFLKDDRRIHDVVAVVILTHHDGKMANGTIIQLNAVMKETVIFSLLAQIEARQRCNRLIQHLRLLRQRGKPRDQVMPYIERIARINALWEIDIRKFGKHLAAHRWARGHCLRHNPWLLGLQRGAFSDLKLPRAFRSTTTTTTTTTTTGSSASISGSFGLSSSDLMNEEAVPIVTQTLDPRLPAPCALGFLLIALLSQSVTVVRLSRHLKSKKRGRPP